MKKYFIVHGMRGMDGPDVWLVLGPPKGYKGCDRRFYGDFGSNPEGEKLAKIFVEALKKTEGMDDGNPVSQV